MNVKFFGFASPVACWKACWLAGYRLKPLSEVASYIEANHHLPDIPSADEVKQKGMGEMEAKLLAKVEELTLHMIQQEKENRELRENLTRENQELRGRIMQLERPLQRLPCSAQHRPSANKERELNMASRGLEQGGRFMGGRKRFQLGGKTEMIP